MEPTQPNPYRAGYCWYGLRAAGNSPQRVCGVEGSVMYRVTSRPAWSGPSGPHAFMYLCNYHAEQLRKKYTVTKVDSLDAPV